jgi:hypothetical protein
MADFKLIIMPAANEASTGRKILPLAGKLKKVETELRLEPSPPPPHILTG